MTVTIYLAVGLLAVGAIAFLDRVAAKVVQPVIRSPERTVPELGFDHEDFTIPSDDHELRAWLIRSPTGEPDAPLVLIAHGWGASYGTVVQLAEPLAQSGYDVLLFDVRGHGRNDAVPYVTVRHFRDDVVAVTQYLAKRFPGRVLVLIGHSLGGAAGVLAAAEGAPMDGLVLIATPADVLQVTAEYLTDQGMPGDLMTRVLRPFWWRRVGGSFLPLTPSRRIGELTLPFLMIQPEHDQRVHRRHADRLAEAAGQAYHLIADREHTDVLAAPETVRLVRDFLEEVRGVGTV